MEEMLTTASVNTTSKPQQFESNEASANKLKNTMIQACERYHLLTPNPK